MSLQVGNQIKNTREDILAELQSSLRKNNVIGITMKDTKELITTAIVNIENEPEGDPTVVLRDHDLHGYPLERNRISLNNIQSVIHFSIDYDDPQYVKVRRKEKFKV